MSKAFKETQEFIEVLGINHNVKFGFIDVSLNYLPQLFAKVSSNKSFLLDFEFPLV